MMQSMMMGMPGMGMPFPMAGAVRCCMYTGCVLVVVRLWGGHTANAASLGLLIHIRCFHNTALPSNRPCLCFHHPPCRHPLAPPNRSIYLRRYGFSPRYPTHPPVLSLHLSSTSVQA